MCLTTPCPACPPYTPTHPHPPTQGFLSSQYNNFWNVSSQSTYIPITSRPSATPGAPPSQFFSGPAVLQVCGCGGGAWGGRDPPARLVCV